MSTPDNSFKNVKGKGNNYILCQKSREIGVSNLHGGAVFKELTGQELKGPGI